MWQSGETLQAPANGWQVNIQCQRQADSRHRIGKIVTPDNLQFRHCNNRLILKTDCLLASHHTQSCLALARNAESKTPARQRRIRINATDIVIPVHYQLATSTKNPPLRCQVIAHVGVAIHMVFADIEYDGHLCTEAFSCLQLKAGELKHIQILARFHQQIQGRLTKLRIQIAAHCKLAFGCPENLCQQGHHGAFTIGAGNRNDWCSGEAGKQVNIARHRHTAGHGIGYFSCLQADTWTHH